MQHVTLKTQLFREGRETLCFYWRDCGCFYVLLIVHLDILCNENKLYALFIFTLFRQTTSTRFGHVYCPSSGDKSKVVPLQA
jgi:hypothetical protein